MAMCVRCIDLNVLNMRTRMPFKYGITSLTAVPHVFVRITAEINGREQVGVASESLVPKWFTKDPGKSIEQDIQEMCKAVRSAARFARSEPNANTIFDWWQGVYAKQAAWGSANGHPSLLWAFGVTLVERAMLDAFCRAQGINFAGAVRNNLLGVRLGDIYEELQDFVPADLLPPRPSRRLTVRHTIGLADPITDGDIASHDRLSDGLPQTLDDCIRRSGLTHFKIKLSGDLQFDIERLKAVAHVVETHCADFAFTLDGNEGLPDIITFRDHWESLHSCDALARFLDHLLFVEQPVHRDAALAPQTTAALHAWKDRPLIIIDESDGALCSCRDALQGGYAGTSHKNCKGVFKGIANACLVAHRTRQRPKVPCVISAEDLVNVGPVALLQDLAVVATLGIEHAERNGHHYFYGLSMYRSAIRHQTTESHPDLYHLDSCGVPVLNVRGGSIELGSVVDSPFGVAIQLDTRQFVSLADWSFATLGLSQANQAP